MNSLLLRTDLSVMIIGYLWQINANICNIFTIFWMTLRPSMAMCLYLSSPITFFLNAMSLSKNVALQQPLRATRKCLMQFWPSLTQLVILNKSDGRQSRNVEIAIPSGHSMLSFINQYLINTNKTDSFFNVFCWTFLYQWCQFWSSF